MKLPRIPINILIPRILRRQVERPDPGSAPGTLEVHDDLPQLSIRRTVYDQQAHETADVPLSGLEDTLAPQPGKTVWLEVQGLGDGDAIQRLGATLGLHPLTVEDIAHVNQRPKQEAFDDYLYMAIVSERTNQVMKVLTIIATIFIPLTFL